MAGPLCLKQPRATMGVWEQPLAGHSSGYTLYSLGSGVFSRDSSSFELASIKPVYGVS